MNASRSRARRNVAAGGATDRPSALACHPARPGPEVKALRESQWWPRERLEALQAHWLRRLVAAAEQVPFYRERLGRRESDAADIATIADLGRLPIFERRDC